METISCPIIALDNNYATVNIKNNTIQIPLSMITKKNVNIVSLQELAINDKLLIQYESKSLNILSAKLTQGPRVSNSGAGSRNFQNYPASPNPFAVASDPYTQTVLIPQPNPIPEYQSPYTYNSNSKLSIVMPPPQPTPQLFNTINNGIGGFEPIALIQLDDSSKNLLKAIFDSYRKIPTGPNNLPLAIIISLLDHSVLNLNTDLINKMRKMITENQHHSVSDSDRSIEILDKVWEIIAKEVPITRKFIELQELHNNCMHDLTRIIRSCIKISALLLYNTKEFEETK